MITLREDQEDVRNKLRAALRNHQAVLTYAPTGFGKTVLAGGLTKLIYERQKRVAFCVHRVDLITQTAKTFQKFKIPFSYIASGIHHNPYMPVQIASIPTLKNRLHIFKPDYVFIDEAHLSMSTGWQSVVDFYVKAGAKIIGLSGSPERLDGKPLGSIWQTMVMGPSVRWLIDRGYLSTYRAFAPAGIDLMDGVHTRGGDYVQSEVEEIMKGKAVLKDAVKKWKKYAAGKRTIAFTRSRESSERLAAQFRAEGVVAVALDGETPQEDRRAAFLGFANRQIDIIVNCALFCEGFDLSAQVDMDVTVEAMLDYAPTQSLAKQIQKWGRTLRAKPYPAIILDLVGNISRHGLPDDDREWSLEGRKKRGSPGVRICQECFASFHGSGACPECGWTQSGGGKGPVKPLEEIDGELEEVDIKAVRRQRAMEQAKAETLDDLIELAKARGYKSPAKWAAHVFTARMAKRPVDTRGSLL